MTVSRLSALLLALPVLAAAPQASPGVRFPPYRPAAPQVAAAAKAALVKELDGVSVDFQQTDLSVGRQALLVEAVSGAVCGNDVGCPYAILFRTSRGWAPVWTGFAFQTGGIMGSTHSGLHDIAVGRKAGFSRLAFDGNRYRETGGP